MPRLAGRMLAAPSLLLAVLLTLAAWPSGVAGSTGATRTLVPIGSGYTSATLQRFAQAAVEQDASGNVELLVLPITFGLSAESTTKSERRKNLDLAETRRGQVEVACNAVKLAAQTCRATLVPMLVRADALLPENLTFFTDDVDGMYILGGDQTVAMGVVAGTPIEDRMAELYLAGAVIGGNSAGAAVQSLTMIGGYVGNNGPENGFQQGSVDIWAPGGADGLRRGLSFGISSVVLDQHVLQRGRIGRLINTAFATGLPGVGADADTAATIVDEAQLTDVVGLSAAFVVDLDTYGADGRYAGPTNSLAIANAVTHVIPAGGFGYDLVNRQPTVDGLALPAPSLEGRSFAALQLPAGRQPLFLGGGLGSSPSGAPIARFVAASGGPGASIVVLTAGYAKASESRAAAKAIAAALQPGVATTVQYFSLDGRYDAAAVAAAIGEPNGGPGATGIWLSSPDQSRVLAALAAAAPVRATALARWQSGHAALMADDAAAAALGARLSADPPMPTTTSALEAAAIDDFRPDGVPIQPGLGVLQGVAVEPRMVSERRWGRLYNLIADGASPLGLGIDAGTAVELTTAGAITRGSSVALTLDGREASFGVGSNGALSARYVVVDSFVDGDVIQVK